jgi:glutathione S-transferase
MRVPALTLPEGTTIGETAAMAILLGERHPEAGLTPEPGDPDRAKFLCWLTAMATSGYPTFSRACHPEQFTTDNSAHDSIMAIAGRQLDEFFDGLEGAIEGEPWMMPRGYSALDIYTAMMTEWVVDRHTLFSSRPRLAALCRAVRERPAYRKVAEDHGLDQAHEAA